MGWGGGGQRLSGENRVGGGIEWRTSRRIIPSIVKEGKKETIGKDSISRLIRWLNYAEDLAKIGSVFEKSRLNSKANLYITRVCIRMNLESFEDSKIHLSLRKKKAGRTGEDIEREADNGGDV